MAPKENHLHQPLVDGPDDSDDEWGLPQHDEPRRRCRHDDRAWYRRYSVPIFFFISILLAVWAGTFIPLGLNSKCAKHTSQRSPVLGDVSIKYETRTFNGSFMAENIYRQPGSDEVDKAWEDLGVDYRAGVISYEDGIASGLSPAHVQVNKLYGGGFVVNVEGMHHLHCLNLVRKALYFNYDRYKKMGHHAFANEEHILRLHVTHCLDTIRQVLMCNVDTGVLPQVWVNPQEPMAFPVFDSKHTCKNYKQVQKWAAKLQAPPHEEVPVDYLSPPLSGQILDEVP